MASLPKLQIQLKQISRVLNKKEEKRVLSALLFAKNAHQGQFRKSGEPFVVHPLSVAITLWKKYQSVDFLIAGLLHDTVEDNPNVKIRDVYQKFGKQVGFLVDAMNKKVAGFYGKKIKFDDKIERLLWAGLQDIRVLILRIEDRKNNLETLNKLPKNKQIRMTFETQAIYYPLQKIFKNKSTTQANIDFQAFIKEKKLTTPQKIKEHLFNTFFKDLNPELYDLVYSNTDKIVWEINNLGWFEKLTNNKNLTKNIEIESLRTEQDGYFQALFLFKKGKLLNMPGQLKALSIKE